MKYINKQMLDFELAPNHPHSTDSISLVNWEVLPLVCNPKKPGGGIQPPTILIYVFISNIWSRVHSY